MNIKCER